MAPTHTSSGLVPLLSDPSVSIYYTVDGPLDGSKPVIALSNSLAATTHLWDDFVATFGDEYTIVRYDARFHGNSPLSTNNQYDYTAVTIDDLAQDLRAVLDHLKIPKLRTLIGLSIGAGVALVFGSKWPDLVEHVVVVGTKAVTDDAVNDTFDQRVALVKEQGPEAIAGQSVRRWFPESWIAAHPEKAAAVESIVAGQKLETYVASVAALKKLDLVPVAEKIGAAGDGGRFLFVAGEDDGTIPRETQLLARIAKSKSVIVPGTGHIVHIQSPDDFYRIVREVLSSSQSAIQSQL